MIKWVKCPYCDKNLCKTDIETPHEITLYLWCKKCKKEVKVNIK